MEKVFLLGASSFIGKNIIEELKENFQLNVLSRPDFDLLDKNSFSKYDFSNSTIIDCINVNNGNAAEIDKCNIDGFGDFITFLKNRHTNFKYFYFSTISVLSPQICAINKYVNSKKIAEDLLIASGITYHIVRLSFPIGKGENPTRLTTRLINSINKNEELTLTDIKLNITSVKCLADNISDLVSFKQNKITFFSNNKYVPLTDLVLAIETVLKRKANYKIVAAKDHFEPLSNEPVHCELDLVKIVSNMI